MKELANIDLRRFRYHTGAEVTPLSPGEHCPPLFRDVGYEAMALFLTGELKRLCGPISPITYLRTADYVEAYTDFGKTGRIMLLQPDTVHPWKSGVDSIYISARETWVDSERMAFVPADLPLARAAIELADAKTTRDVGDIIGPSVYRDARDDTLFRLRELKRTHEQAEIFAAPLRRLYQSPDQRDREQARATMQQFELTENDLCSAWHHLPAERRRLISGLAGGEYRSET